ncbi:SDR family oxidoreductase [Carboxylicivirga mesophila]|uniref:SDR family oxidoreductase n=1 Tax=Carboxylicivirga mesophila TaxID=1166478 RepID=A0ABS5KDP2_9BACT|nr:SDR family NAD(P)-dependent oxidoreductase [Carboxylicivirga mesophila]MBS2213141.1 SDR family oxidoreductase [Carboxylicivirga mesophila]
MNKQVLITGGAKRVGRYLSQHFARAGYDVLIHVNQSQKEGELLVTELSEKYPDQQFVLLTYNLSDWKQLPAYIKQAFDDYGLPDVIIHNASRYAPGYLHEASVQTMEEMMAIHLYAPMIIGQQYRKVGGHGSIINLLDTAIITNDTSHAMYLLAKKSLAEYTKMSALEWAPEIRVNGIALGPVLPPEGKDNSFFNSVVESTPLKNKVELANITSTIDFIIANENMSGQIIYCDSAQHLI